MLRLWLLCAILPLLSAEVARNGVVNAASPGIGIAPDSRFVIRGVHLSGPVRIDGREIPVLSESKTLIEAWLPPGQSAGVHNLDVGGDRRSITIERLATGIYSAEVQGGQLSLRITGSTPAGIRVGSGLAHVDRVIPREKGLRELRAAIPATASKGCAVPVSTEASNFVSVAIGDPCPQPDFLPAQGETNGLIALVRNRSGNRVFDEGWAIFARGRRKLPIPPDGACTAFLSPISDAPLPVTGFSVGPFVQVAAGSQRRRLPAARGVAGLYHGFLGGDDGTRPPVPLFFGDSNLLVESSQFRDVLVPPSSPLGALIPRNASRRAGFDVTWPRTTGKVVIALVSKNVDTELRGGCLCVATAEQGRFRIPSSVLTPLPADEWSEIVLARFYPAMWKKIDSRGFDGLYGVAVTVDSNVLRLD